MIDCFIQADYILQKIFSRHCIIGNDIFQLFLRRDLGWLFNQLYSENKLLQRYKKWNKWADYTLQKIFSMHCIIGNDMFSIIWAAMQPTYSNQQKCIQRINDKNDSKDNPEDDSSTKSNCIVDNTLVILANSRRNHKRRY